MTATDVNADLTALRAAMLVRHRRASAQPEFGDRTALPPDVPPDGELTAALAATTRWPWERFDNWQIQLERHVSGWLTTLAYGDAPHCGDLGTTRQMLAYARRTARDAAWVLYVDIHDLAILAGLRCALDHAWQGPRTITDTTYEARYEHLRWAVLECRRAALELAPTVLD